MARLPEEISTLKVVNCSGYTWLLVTYSDGTHWRQPIFAGDLSTRFKANRLTQNTPLEQYTRKNRALLRAAIKKELQAHLNDNKYMRAFG